METRRLLTNNTELTFIGRFGTVVHMCDGPEIPIKERAVLTVSQTVTGDSPAVVLTYASRLEEKHLALHLEAGTEPCTPKVDPVSALYKNRANRVVWINALATFTSP